MLTRSNAPAATEPRIVAAVDYIIAQLRQVPDLNERARAILAVRAEAVAHTDRFDSLLGETIIEMRQLDQPPTFAEIGEVLALTASRVHQLHTEALTRATKKG